MARDSKALAERSQQQHRGQKHSYLDVVVAGVARAHAFFKIALRLFGQLRRPLVELAFLYSVMKIGPCGADRILDRVELQPGLECDGVFGAEPSLVEISDLVAAAQPSRLPSR